ncbi:serine hydrolase [Luteimonas lutimaris]|uniref:D-alanyl-D-alanine dipeptidase n=1 Tax=Luteimonas lutimaris TaxID=698645 RepID=A0ABP7MUY0_9GAMM
MTSLRLPFHAIAFVLLAALPLAGAAEPAGEAPDTAAIDRAFDDTVARYELPGLAVGVVVDGKVVYTRTAGELEAGSGRRIDADTLFKIASNSKAMTTGLLARLVDAGKLKWDDPVVKYLPDFRMYDPWVTREMQVRDLLIHNSGLGAGAGDLMLWPGPNDFTRADVIHGLRYLKPKYSFRSRYAYDNTLYIVAGEVAAAAGGAPYDALLRRELFEPLGLKRCQVGAWDRDAVGNVAQPHARRDGRNVVTSADEAMIPDVPMMAAGGIRCSLHDMLAWATMWLQPEQSGLVDGKPWLSEEQREAVWSPQTIMPLSRRMREWDDSHYSAYGYGWRLADVDGTQKVSHTGTLSGMYSALTLLPQKHAGFVILINSNADDARTVLNQVLVKQFTAPEQQRTVAYYADQLNRDAREARVRRPVPDTSSRVPAVPADMAGQLGVYRDPWFGDVLICPAGDGVRFTSAKSPRLVGDVMRAGDRLLVQWRSGGDTEPWLDFGPADAQPVTLAMAKIDPDADFSSDFEDLAFVRSGDCPAAAAAASDVPTVSPAADAESAGMADIRALVPDMAQDIRYAGSHNFVGKPVDGYEAPRCYLLRPVAEALARVEATLRESNRRLLIYDCFRPVRAVQHFMRWAQDPDDVANKAEFYPLLGKDALVPQYIAEHSGHSRGATLDLTMMQCDAGGENCEPLDMGTGFDYFGELAHTDTPNVTAAQRENRHLLRDAMQAQGFSNYTDEWWHYTLKPEPDPHTAYDFPLR